MYQLTVYFDGEASDRLAMSKARIAPLKFPTIPRLELQAAVARLRVGLKVAEELRIPKTKCCFWSDSQTVFQWINYTSRRYHVFVANRISEILDDTSPAQWRHVPGNINQADELSRGSQPEDFVTSDTWFTGPEFLRGPENIWPSSNLQLDQEDQEVVSQHWISATQVQPVACKSSLYERIFSRYSEIEESSPDSRLDQETGEAASRKNIKRRRDPKSKNRVHQDVSRTLVRARNPRSQDKPPN